MVRTTNKFSSTNTGMTVSENAIGNVISTVMLDTIDLDQSAAQLIYTITDGCDQWQIRLGGVALNQNDTFTQADVDAGLVTYDHDGSETASDSFAFSVDDGIGSPTVGTFAVTINPVNDEVPEITSNGGGNTATISINENETFVTNVTATDADLPSQTLTYSITGGDDAGLFDIDPSTGHLVFRVAPDRESAMDLDNDHVYEVQVTASDGSLLDTQDIQVSILDLDEHDVTQPTDSDAAVNAVDENQSGALVGLTANAFDLDATNSTITYSLSSNPDNLFAIDPTTGVVTTAVAIDREFHGGLRTITVTATSSDLSTATQDFTITINDVDEFDVVALGDTDSAPNQVDENSGAGVSVGITVWAVDGDATNSTVTHTLVDNAGGRFAIDAVSGQIVTSATAPLNYEVDTSHVVSVRSVSADGSEVLQMHTINILDINEAPVAVNDSYNTFASQAVSLTTPRLQRQ